MQQKFDFCGFILNESFFVFWCFLIILLVMFKHSENAMEGEGRAASLQGRERNVTADVTACTVGAMTSLLLLVVMYTHTEGRNNGQNDGQND